MNPSNVGSLITSVILLIVTSSAILKGTGKLLNEIEWG